MTVDPVYQPAIAVHFAQVVSRRAAELGLAEERLLEALALNREQLADPRTRISPAQLGSLQRLVWRELDDETMGFGAMPHRFGLFALMARQMVASPDLDTALRYSARFINLCSYAIRWELRVGQQVRLELSLLPPRRDDDHFLQEFMLLIWHRFINWLVGERIPLLGTELGFEPTPHRAEYQLMFPGPLSFDHPCSAIHFASEWMQAPVVRSRQELRRYLQHLPDEWFIRQTFAGTVSERVLQALEREEPLPTLEQLAARWRISARTLHRQLQREGSSYRRLNEQARRDRAMGLLLSSDCQVREVAQALGMTEPAFSRAFRQWTGMAPLAWRRSRR